MACISHPRATEVASPDPQAWNLAASSNQRNHLLQANGGNQPSFAGIPSEANARMQSSTTSFRQAKSPISRVIDTMDARKHTPLAVTVSFHQVVKSPISHCIDTIIGAAKVLDNRDSFVTEHEPTENEPTTKPKALSKSVSKKKTTSTINKGGCFLDPLEERLEDDTEIYRKVIMTMALQRPRTPVNPHPTKEPARVIGEGFYWKEYPRLEDVLYEHMEEYYDWSTRERQSKQQQAFNNALVEKVRSTAFADGHRFDSSHFTDKRLRDRIRCFYKTHLQNAKKRLQTMKKHMANADHKKSLEELIEQAESHVKSDQRLISVVSTSDCDSDVPKKKRQRPL